MSRSAPARSNAVIDEGRPCHSCASSRKVEFNGEICMHFPGGLESLNKPLLWAYPKVVVCLDCGSAQFTVADAELKLIHENLGNGGVRKRPAKLTRC
jgi:hypothetical protein